MSESTTAAVPVGLPQIGALARVRQRLYLGMHSTSLPTKSPVQVIDDIRTKLADKRSGSGAAYAMIVGAGFSYGSVPLTKELLHEHIGDFYYDQDMSAMERSREECRKLSAD